MSEHLSEQAAEIQRLRETLIVRERVLKTEIAKWRKATFEREADKNAAEGRARIAEHKLTERDAVLGAVAALADEYERDRDVCVEWLHDPTKIMDAGHPARLSLMAETLNTFATRLRAVLAPVSGAVEEEPGACPEHGPGNTLIGGVAACVHIDPKLVDGAVAKPEPDTLTLSAESMEAVGTSIQNAAGGADFPLPEYVAVAIAENLIASTWLRDRLVAKHEQEVRAVSLADIDRQRELGWPDFHPEDYCHRCAGKNISWWIDSEAWNTVMRPDGPDSTWRWNEIICPLCFAELFAERFPNTSWRLSIDPDTIGGRAFAARADSLAEGQS